RGPTRGRAGTASASSASRAAGTTERVMAAVSRYARVKPARPGQISPRREDLWAGLLDPGAYPFPAGLRLLVAFGGGLDQLGVAHRAGGLEENDPGDLGVLRREVQVAQVPQEEQTGGLGLADQLGAGAAQGLEHARSLRHAA